MAAWAIAKTDGKVNALVLGPEEMTPTGPLKKAVLDAFQGELPHPAKPPLSTRPTAEWGTKIQPAVQAALLADPSINGRSAL